MFENLVVSDRNLIPVFISEGEFIASVLNTTNAS
jgi:hypothetical protein